MANISWVGLQGGSWGTQADWSGAMLPGAQDAVTIAGQVGLPPITVTVGSGVAAMANTLATTSLATLSINGGSLYTASLATFSGVFNDISGTYTAGGYGATFYNTLYLGAKAGTTPGGTIHLLSGQLLVNDGATLGGTLSGTGVLNLSAGTSYINAGFACSLSNIVVGEQGGKLGFNANFVDKTGFTETSGGVVDMFGHVLVLDGTSVLDGVVGWGTLEVGATGTLSLGTGAALSTILDNGLTMDVYGTVVDKGNFDLGYYDAGARMAVAKSGIFNITGDWNIGDPSSIGSITNAGLFAKLAGGATATVAPSFASTGTVNVAIGELLLNGLVNSLAGSVTGGGTLAVAGGITTLGNKVLLQEGGFNQDAGQLALNAPLAYAGQWNMYGGELNLNEKTAALTLNGQADFDGGTVEGYGGKVVLNGAAQFGGVTFGGPNFIDINGIVHQTDSINFGLSSNPQANIAKGGAWLLDGNGSVNDNDINGTYGLIVNAGTFGVTNGSGNSIVYCELASTGTLVASHSTLTLAGISELNGLVTGSGVLSLAGTAVLEAGVMVNVASLNVSGQAYLGGNLSYANLYTQTNGNLNMGDFTFSVGGGASLDLGSISTGALSIAGVTSVNNFTIEQDAALIVRGQAEQVNPYAQLNDYGVLSVAAGGSYTLDDDLSVLGNGQVVNAGTFSANGGGVSEIAPMLISTGNLAVNDHRLVLGGGGNLQGTVSGTGTLELAGYVTYTLGSAAAALTIGSGGLELDSGVTTMLAANESYAGAYVQLGGVVQLGGDTLTLSGASTLTAGAFQGLGTLNIAGTGTLASTYNSLSVTGGGTLQISGNVEQLGLIQIGEQSSGTTPPSPEMMVIAKGGSDTLDTNAVIAGNGTLSVAGTLIAASDSRMVVGPTVVDSGTILANLGTLVMLGAVSGSGGFTIGNGGLLDFSSSSAITSTNTVNFTAGGGVLEIDNLATFNATLANFGAQDVIELSPLTGAVQPLTYGATHDQIIVSDSSGHSITLSFSTAQTLSQITVGTTNGLASLTHN